MATLTPLYTANPTSDPAVIKALLATLGIEFETWALPARAQELAAQSRLGDAEKAELLTLFQEKLHEKAATAGYRSADVVAIRPDLPGVDEALAKFDKVHFHDDDEVRAIVGGEGVFGVVGDDGRQVLLTLRAGEYISLPAGIWHWFYCLESKNVTALRLFKDNPSWVARYRGVDRGVPPNAS